MEEGKHDLEICSRLTPMRFTSGCSGKTWHEQLQGINVCSQAVCNGKLQHKLKAYGLKSKVVKARSQSSK